MPEAKTLKIDGDMSKVFRSQHERHNLSIIIKIVMMNYNSLTKIKPHEPIEI